MEEYKSNSHKSKEQQGASGSSPKKIDGVISGSASRKKRSEAKKFADVFIQEDVSNVKSYILMDVLVPAVKKALSDIVKDGVDMILYGETNRNRKNGNTSRVNDIIDQYGIVSVADLYDLANLDHPPYTMNKYGWTNIAGAKAMRVRDGYALKLPRAVPIN